ncbi:MAG TPA: glycosyltransferase, partial [Ignavibacteriales bacterium]|nr:glycosyltransferase [Ignavibacteriales bacterium]
TNYSCTKPIEVIPNFIDSELYKPNEQTSFRDHIAPNGEKILVHTSNFRTVKRVPDTIRILKKVREDIPAKLVLVGDGPDRSECERLCRQLDLCDDVKFLGKQEGLVEILNSADLFLIPSQSESFGLAALEAMSCGLPVISTSVGGLPELVKHNETGFVAEIGDIDRMSKYAVDLLTNEKKFKLFSHNARQRAINQFDKSKVVPIYEKYYKTILGK